MVLVGPHAVMSREIDIAIDAARRAGRLLLDATDDLKSLQQKEDDDARRESRQGLVTEMDRRCEREILSVLSAAFPQDGFLGEEQTALNLGRERVWVIDPLDGTISYARGLDAYATAIALLQHNEPVLGVVYLPDRDELFAAEAGAGATRNGQRIHVTAEAAVESCVLSMDHRIFRSGLHPRATGDLVRRVRRLRVADSGSRELCYVACGRVDGFIRMQQPTYDFVMGRVIVEEAGGVVRDFGGGPIGVRRDRERGANLVAGNARLVEQLTTYLAT